jgi:hypothetical protein
VERVKGELGELGWREPILTKRSAELLTQVEVTRLLMQSSKGGSLIALAVEIKKVEDTCLAINKAKESFVRMKKTKESWQEEWEVSFNTLLIRMVTRITRILRLESTLLSFIINMFNHNDNYNRNPSRGRAYSGSRRERDSNSINSCNLINSANTPIFRVDH